MITIRIEKDKIFVTGHAGYEETGKDIVCASVSSILITSINAIMRISSEAISYKESDGVEIIIHKHEKIVDILLENMVELFEELTNQYPEYIKIRRC